MTLQRRLTLGIGVILLGLIIFLSYTTNSFHRIDYFITSSLFQEIEIARSYEYLANLWLETFDLGKQNLIDQRRKEPLVPEEMVKRLEDSVEKLSRLMTDSSYKVSFAPIRSVAREYLNKLRELERLSALRSSLARRMIQRRAEASQEIIAKVGDLLNRYRKMTADFSKALKNADFQASLGATSNLMVKISRIERDLEIAEQEVAFYLSISQNQSSPPVDSGMPADRSVLAERIQKRLQAVIGLLTRSIEDTSNPLQLRVFSAIRTKIQEFRNNFAELRDSLEHSDSEKIELDDRITALTSDLEELRRRGVSMSFQEANIFWQRITQTSNRLIDRIRANQHAGLVLVVMAFGLGAYLVFFFPAKILAPLRNLAMAVENFRLGNEFSEPKPTGYTEIDTLGTVFFKASQRLNAQGALIQRYLSTIRELENVYMTLLIYPEQEEELEAPRQRLEKAVNTVLEKLLETIPLIDLVKLMVFPRNPKNGTPDQNGPLVRLGETHVSTSFRNNQEFIEYSKSLEEGGDLGQSEEAIPLGEGLTGWFFQEIASPTLGEGEQDLNPVYPIQPIQNYTNLQNRKLEKGLRGCLHLEKIFRPNAPEDLDRIEEPPALGALFVYFARPDILLSWQDLSFIKIVANLLGSVLETHYLQQKSEKMRKIDQQLETAREIQESLLPAKIPQMPGLIVDACSQPAADVGGDYYDFFILSKTRLGVIIADAVGKNVPAAILMTVLKTVMSTMEKDNMGAAEVLTKANSIILRNITSERFITALYAIIDASSGEIELACAGHLPALIVSGNGAQRTIHEKGMSALPLGIAEVEYSAIHFKLQSGDLMVLYTDGVTDAPDITRKRFGISGLKRFLAGPRTECMAKDLVAAVKKFAEGMPPQDDITALTIEYKGTKS